MTESQRIQLPEKQEGGRASLAVMEGRLAGFNWFDGHAMNIADIALYAYTRVEGEGGFDLSDYPRVNDWLGRVREEPGHVPMEPAPERIVVPVGA